MVLQALDLHPEDVLAWVQSELTDKLESIFTLGKAGDLVDEDSIADVRAAIPAIAEALRLCLPAARVT
jgi:hypothetical protein